MARGRLGIDLGGTKIEGVVLGDHGAVLAQRRVPTPAADGYEAIVSAVAALAVALEAESGLACSIGIGTPGARSPATGLLRNANTVCLNGRPFDRDLSRALGREVAMANDADCFALSEASDGAGAGAPSVFGVIVGTGTGGGLVVNGALVQGPNAIAGEWGHNPLPWPRAEETPGPPCYCGKQGCIETWLSGPGLAADHAAVAGEPIAPEQIAARAAAGDPAARETLARHADRFARALASVLNVFDPHVVVLGGGVSGLPGLCETLRAGLGAYLFSDTVDTEVRLARFGDASGVRGAAWLGASAAAWPIVRTDSSATP